MAGCIITIDAMSTQTAIASQIFNAKADYVLALKANHPTLYGQVKNWFEQHLSQGFKGIIHSYDKRVEKGHHRTEKRQIWCVPISQLQTLHNQDGCDSFGSTEYDIRIINDKSTTVVLTAKNVLDGIGL